MNGQDSLRTIRRAHEGVVLDHVTRSGPLSRSELIARTGLSRTTLLALVTDLVDRGTLLEIRAERDRPQRGRPLQLIGLNPRGGLWMALEVAPARVRVAFANAAHEVIGKQECAIDRGASREVKIRTVDRLVATVCADNDIATGSLRGIALAVVNAVGAAPGANRPGGARHPADRDAAAIARHLERRFAAQVLVDNNTRLAAYAESTWGVARGLPNVIYVRLSDSVAMGAVVAGRVVGGAHESAGAIGGVGVDSAGRPGQSGSLESRLGMAGLEAGCRERGLQVNSAGQFFAAVESGNKTARRVLRGAVDALIGVLLPIVAALDPDAVVIGGSLTRLQALVIDPVRAAVAEAFARPGVIAPEVLVGELDNFAAVSGGLALMLNSRFDPVHLEGRIASTGLLVDAPSDGVPTKR